MFKKVIVGVDGQEGGRDAIALAQRLVDLTGTLTLACVYRRDPVAWRGPGAAYNAAERDHCQTMVEQAREDAGAPAEIRVCGASSVGRGLHELAEALHADLLVVGSSRRGLVGRVLIGDDTCAALNGAPCAVAVAPADYARQPVAMREIGVGYDGSPESEHALAIARRFAEVHHTSLSAFEAVAMPAYVFPTAGVLRELIDDMVASARDRVAALEGVEPHAAFGDPALELALYSASLDLLAIGSRGYGPLGRLLHGSTSRALTRSARCPLLILPRSAHDDEHAEPQPVGDATAVNV